MPYLIDFFLLFDECEKMVSEIDFRPKINLPIDDFFKFKGKAMVSATPIVMSDPRFEKQRFKVIKILPKFDHKLLLELKPTNNVTITVKRTVETVDKDATVCIFYNSVEGIEDLIAFLDISDQSNIYCSTAASKKLHRRKYSNVFDSVTDENGHTALNKYNFFTSRFYSAVDIEVANKPIVIMITQVYKAAPKVVHPNTPFIIRQQAELKHTPYTLIDPETEAIQIAGRFRNGIDRLIHITNTSYDLGYRVHAVMEQFLKEQHSGFHKMLELERSVEQYGEKWIIRDALQSTEYWKEGYINGENLEINFFRYDNAYLDERLKMLYNFPASLYKAYKRTGAFDIVSKSENVIYTDEEKQKLENASKAKIAKLLVEIMNRDADSDDPYNEQLRQGLKCDFPLMVEAINVIGYARMKALRFRDSALEAEIARVKSENKAQSDKVKLAIYKTFKENTWYPAAYINENIHRIFTDNGAECNRQGLGGHLALYFRVEEKRQSRGARGWMIHEKLDV